MQLEKPMIIPAYFGAISNGLTINPVKENPKNATAMHMNATAISDRSGNPDKMMNDDEPTIPDEIKFFITDVILNCCLQQASRAI